MSAVLALGLSAMLTTDAAAQGRRGGGMMGGGGIAGLLTNEGVQKELKLDEDQISKANELAEKAREKMQEARSSLEGLEGQERMQKMMELSRDLNASIKKDASEFLKSDQLTRLTQIEYQSRGPAVFADPEVAAKLKITDDQKAAIRDIMQESMEEMRSIFSNSGGNREEARAKMIELQKSTKEKVEGKLTDDQKKAWKEMIGAPFEVRFAPRQRRENN
jgi:Spy/CpxP family protein refolding chaperone